MSLQLILHTSRERLYTLYTLVIFFRLRATLVCMWHLPNKRYIFLLWNTWICFYRRSYIVYKSSALRNYFFCYIKKRHCLVEFWSEFTHATHRWLSLEMILKQWEASLTCEKNLSSVINNVKLSTLLPPNE
jgi:hypothetical protein